MAATAATAAAAAPAAENKTEETKTEENKTEETAEASGSGYAKATSLEAGKAYYLGTYKSKYAGKFPYMKVIMYYQGTKVSKKLGRFATKAHYDGWTFLEPSDPCFTVVDHGNQTRDSFSYTDNFD